MLMTSLDQEPKQALAGFAHYDRDLLDRMFGDAKPEKYAAGRLLFLQDDPSDRIYGLLGGSVEISIYSTGGDKLVANLQFPPSLIGEIGVLDGGRRTATAICRSDCSIVSLTRKQVLDRIEQEKTTNPKEDYSRAHNTHSAIFAEVHVDEEIGVIRVTRAVSAVAGGRILNTKTATSQILGGVVWGIGMALHEETVIDHKFGRIMNANIAEYHVPVHADIHDIKVIFVDEEDDSNPLGIKGLGEIGIVGVAAAVANAVYHATGKRVRDLPITLDKVMA